MLQDDHRAFRRQLEDKRPVVESNLLSGRQYIASEPPLSDTSDTECECTFALVLTKCRSHVAEFSADKLTICQNKWMLMYVQHTTDEHSRYDQISE